MKYKIFDYLIIIMIIICIISWSSYFIKSYNIKNEEYNETVENFIIEVINGNKTKEDINNFNISEKMKKSLINYIETTFYKDDDLVKIYDNIEEIGIITNELVNDLEVCKIDGIFNIDLFLDLCYKKFELSNLDEKNGVYLYKYRQVYENVNEDEIEKFENKETDERLIVIDDSLFMKAIDIPYESFLVFYNGVEIDVNTSLLEKEILKLFKNRYKDNQINIESKFKNSDSEYSISYIVRDDNNRVFDFNIKKKFGKFEDVIFIK